jgi:hypothetical protein
MERLIEELVLWVVYCNFWKTRAIQRSLLLLYF